MSDSSSKTQPPAAEWQPLAAAQHSNPPEPSTDATFKAVSQPAPSDATFRSLVPSSSPPNIEADFSPLFGGSAAASTASQVRQKGQEEIQKVLEQEAFDKGYAAGQAQGLEEVMDKSQAKLEHLGQLIAQIDTLWQQLVQKYEQQILGLVCRVAQKVVAGQVSIDQDSVRRTIMQVFEQMPEPAHVAIEVSLEDFEFIEEVKEDFFKQIKGLKQVSVAANPAISAGGCKIRTTSGEIDASIEARLSAISQSIMEAAALKAQEQATPAGAETQSTDQMS